MGLRIRYVLDTHTHADHFSAAKELGKTLDVPVVTSRLSPAPYAGFKLADGEILRVGNMRLRALHTPGHTRDSMCVLAEDRIFTGDTLLIGGTGRTDLPTGDPDALYDSLFGTVLKQDPALKVYPAHDYKGRSHSTIADEIANNPRLQKRDRSEFIAMMNQLNLDAPTHLTEALRTNMSGGKTVAQLLSEACARVPFVSMDELAERVGRNDLGLILLDVREKDAFAGGHIPGAQPSAARAVGTAGEQGTARSHPPHSGGLRVRAHFHPGGGDLARTGLHPGSGAGRRHEGVARERAAGDGAVTA